MSMIKKQCTIYIVDDHPIVAQGMKMLLQDEEAFSICGVADNANEAVRCIERLRPDIAIVDINLKDGASGLDLIKALVKRVPETKAIVLSMHDDELYAERAIRAGAMGYVKKSELTETLIRALHCVREGKIYLNETMAQRILEGSVHNKLDPGTDLLELLTNRELEILRLIGKGHKIKEIGMLLHLSVKTVDNHRNNIREKLNLKNAAELARFAVEWASKSSE